MSAYSYTCIYNYTRIIVHRLVRVFMHAEQNILHWTKVAQEYNQEFNVKRQTDQEMYLG